MMNMPMMLTCREFEDFLLDYSEKKLPMVASLAFKMHMMMCSKCRRYVKSYLKTIELSKKSLCNKSDELPQDIPEELVNTIMELRKKVIKPEQEL